jgi:glycosyltransferase involved in cell wall biosynthesis
MDVQESLAERTVFSTKGGAMATKSEPGLRAPGRMLSVIIPAHNEERYLAKTLEALHRQTYPCFEIIVVANGCTDRTTDMARDRCDRLVVLSQKSLGIARNLGARMAKGDILVFLDADTLLDPDALQNIADTFTPHDAAGTVKGRPDGDLLRYKVVYGLKNAAHATAVHCGSSGVILCWKRHFMDVGGFDEDLQVRENSHLIRRLLRFGAYRYVRDAVATTSMRRYASRGFWNTTWLWVRVWVKSFFGDLHRQSYETVR